MVRARRWWVAVPVVQTPDPADVATELAQRRSLLHGGTLLSAGTAEVVVVATGDRRPCRAWPHLGGAAP